MRFIGRVQNSSPDIDLFPKIHANSWFVTINPVGLVNLTLTSVGLVKLATQAATGNCLVPSLFRHPA